MYDSQNGIFQSNFVVAEQSSRINFGKTVKNVSTEASELPDSFGNKNVFETLCVNLIELEENNFPNFCFSFKIKFVAITIALSIPSLAH